MAGEKVDFSIGEKISGKGTNELLDALLTELLQKTEPGDIQQVNFAALALQFDGASAPILYLGEAAAGSATSAAAWRIAKIDTTTQVAITWADGNTNFDNVWNDRAGLSYS